MTVGVELTSRGIDVGIVVADLGRAIAFYRDLLGLADEGEMPMPTGGRMRRLRCGESLVKLIQPHEPPITDDRERTLTDAAGIRYLTVSVSNLDDLHDELVDAGIDEVLPPLDIRPGVRISMLEDPDRNWIELMQATEPPAETGA